MEAAEKKLSNRGFLEKAPDDIVEKVREKVESMKNKMEKMENNLKFFTDIDD